MPLLNPHPALPRRDVDRQVDAELVNLLFRHSRGLHASTALGSVLIAALFWQHVDHLVLVLWALYMLITGLTRSLVAHRFQREDIPAADAGAWLARFRSGNLLTGLGWSAAGILLFLPENQVAQLILTVIIFAAIAASLPSLSAHRSMFVEFALLAVTPLLLRHVWAGSANNLIAAALLLFLFPMLAAFALRSFRQMSDELRARFAYADLVHELSGEVAVRRHAENRLLELASYDQLTGLPNRSLLRDRLEMSVTRAKRHNRKVAVLFADLDRFKHVNDSLGHHAGDEVLRATAERLQAGVRRENTVARLSGDEFIITVEDFESVDELRSLARRLLMAISEPVALPDGSDVSLTASIGAALFPDHGRDVDTLLQNADIAMYRAKLAGRNGFVLFSPEMQAEALTRLSREKALRRALDNEEFWLSYQPQVDTRSRQVIGVEALLRWESREYGLVPPDEFIPLAEDTGLIRPLGAWAMQLAFEQAKRFEESFGAGFHVGVNLSARQFDEERLLEIITQNLERSGVNPATIMFEITESVAMTNAHSNLALLRRLRAMGFGLALDDFGTGHSSLAYLKRFPISCVKLDKSFIDNVAVNREDGAIARATIELARALELDVIAEGVETREQAEWLQEHDCFLMQGFLFSPPLRAHECPEQIGMGGAQNRPSANG